jgi:hypothetical protein
MRMPSEIAKWPDRANGKSPELEAPLVFGKLISSKPRIGMK